MVKQGIRDIKEVKCQGKVISKNKLGGFAKCYEGLNIETKKMYAMKVIDKATLQKNRAKQKVTLQ